MVQRKQDSIGRTNLEKWNYYLSVLQQQADVFMDTISTLTPAVFYRVWPNGKVDECHVLNRNYSLGLYYSGKKPSREKVEEIKAVFDTGVVFTPEKAYFDYYYFWGDGLKAQTAIRMQTVFTNDVAFLDKAGAEAKSKVLASFNEEDKAFRELHKKDTRYDYARNGYKFLGWQNGWRHVHYDEDGGLCSATGKPARSFGYTTADHPEYGKCRDLKHRHIRVSHNIRGSENTVSCPVCKIYWKYDCSD